MPKANSLTALGKVSLVVLLASPWLVARAQSKPAKMATAPGPVPAQIANAKSVFISNTAPDGMPSIILENFKEPNRPYDQLYAAMKAWGRYTLADSPADADLVMEIHFRASAYTGGLGQGEEFYLSILDAKTHFVLWTFIEPVEAAVRKASWEKNVDTSVTGLVNDMKTVAGGQQQ
ncbi:MAG: hypothetical protein WBE20_04570 [Candidatus Acidiferrales bacterium]